jgi:hypothetical protein
VAVIGEDAAQAIKKMRMNREGRSKGRAIKGELKQVKGEDESEV